MLKRNRNKEGWEWGKYWLWFHRGNLFWYGFGKEKGLLATYWPDNPKLPCEICHYHIIWCGFFILEVRM